MKGPGLIQILVPILIIIAVAWGALSFLRSYLGGARPQTQVFELKVGATLPDLSLPSADGKITQLSSVPHKVILINFWATWCEACMEEMPSLVKVRDTFAVQGFEIYGVNLDEKPGPAIASTTAEFGIKFPNFTDADGKLGDLFDVHAIPLSIIVDSSRKVLEVTSGDRNWMAADFTNKLKGWLAQGSQPSR